MLYLSVSPFPPRMPVTSGPRPAAAVPPEPAKRLTGCARAAAAGPRAAVPSGGLGRTRARRGRPAARLGNRRLNHTRSEEAGTYRRKGRSGGSQGSRAARTGDRRWRDAR
jgi:hypothetical protein